MNDQTRYFRFVAQFVDSVITEPLMQTLRNGPQEVARLRRRNERAITEAAPPLARAA
jgi:hypothetical protein